MNRETGAGKHAKKTTLQRRKRLEEAIVNDGMIIANALRRIKQAKKELAVSRETKEKRPSR